MRVSRACVHACAKKQLQDLNPSACVSANASGGMSGCDELTAG